MNEKEAALASAKKLLDEIISPMQKSRIDASDRVFFVKELADYILGFRQGVTRGEFPPALEISTKEPGRREIAKDILLVSLKTIDDPGLDEARNACGWAFDLADAFLEAEGGAP